MKKVLLATAAIVAFSFPAMAQQRSTEPQQSQMQRPSGTSDSENQPAQKQPSASKEQQTQGEQQKQQAQSERQNINPSDLSQDVVKKIQQALDQKGFSVKKVDGVWGPNTEAALRKFQEDKDIKANGQLTKETMAELGLAQGAEPSSTTGAAPSQEPSQSSGQEQNPPKASGSSQSEDSTPSAQSPSKEQSPQYK